MAKLKFHKHLTLHKHISLKGPQTDVNKNKEIFD